jgi:glycosyltransferase involved in cell wall biosynthesis
MRLFNKPLVSVVLASYNHAPFIKEAVESVLNQSLDNLELLVLDDGSTDGSADLVAKIKDRRLKLIRLHPNRRFHPRNLGIKMAKGKYIAFQNSDDVWSKNKLHQQVNYLEQNRETVVCFTRIEMIDKKGKTIKRSWAHNNLAGANRNNDAWLRSLFTTPTNFGIASALVRKSQLNQLKGFNESMVQMADYDLWVRLLGLGQLHIIDGALTKMRVIDGVNLSSPRKEVYLRSAFENVDILNHYTEWPINKYLPAVFPDVIPTNIHLKNIQYAALAKYAWTINTSHHVLFADQLITKLLNSPQASQEILQHFGADLKKEYIKRRGKLEIKIIK